MKFSKVIINNVRNIIEVNFYPSNKFNFIFGTNGSGKTSLLESLYYFGHARSFRSHLIKRIINHDHQIMTLFGELISPDNFTLTIGIQRDNQQTSKIQIQKQQIKNTGELATLLPILLINPDSFTLLEGGSKLRRALLDWGVFHVEQSYYAQWVRFQRYLKQRNMALKQGLSCEQVAAWDEEFCILGNEIDEFRKKYCEELHLKFLPIIQELLPDISIDFSYHRGWTKERELKDLLKEHFIEDKDRGYSFYGPQRGDLVLKIGTVPLVDFLSRGQQKVVVCALRIAQAQLLHEQTKKECIFLIDDLAAELGDVYRSYLIEELNKLNAQVYITAIEKESLWQSLQNKDVKMFHVEQGRLKEVMHILPGSPY
ncbi:MAG: DNA replication/repair protein RecF [Gammaproteobacteria bacterium]|nr:DNA replication/repair protein RecF [Gammaproteobacteria bacterium]